MARVYTDETSKDLVVASDPPGETLVEQGTVVNLLVSLGPRPQNYLLPDLTGRGIDDVARSLREEGFPVQVREGGPKQKAGLVSDQQPSPGHRVSPRDSIVLYEHP
jgi:serine/threonine-protein kinase